MFYMARKLGAWQADGDENQGRVQFKLFFPRGPDPHIRAVKAAGSFQNRLDPRAADWDFPAGLPLARDDADPAGTFWSCTSPKPLPADFYEYKYLVEFDDGTTRIVSDPCARYGGTEYQNAAFVIGGSRPADNVVRPLRSARKHLRDLVVYEMNIDDFTDEYRGARAPLDSVVDKLDYLADHGFNAILFMPWTAWKHRAYDWGYEPFQYFAVEYRLANDLYHPTEKISWLKKLVSACHDRDIHVIMDGVYNHVSVDFAYKALYRDPSDCPYCGTFGGMFTGLQDLDFGNTCTQELIRDVCLYWIENFGIDGIRFDNTVNFYCAGDPRGLVTLLSDIKNYCNGAGQRNFSLTLEHINMDAANVTNNSDATSYWDNALYERCFQYLWHGRIDSRFLNALNNRRYLTSADKVPTSYLSNHDHAHVTWQAGARSNRGAGEWYRTQPYVIALFTAAATPFIQNGQEFAVDYWIPENDEGTGRRVIPRPIQWKCADDRFGTALRRLYKRMAEIRRDYTVLRTGAFDPDYWEEWQTRFNNGGYGIDTERQLAVYRRSGTNERGERHFFVIVLNFSGSDQQVSVPFPQDGIWTDLLSDYRGAWQPRIQNGRLDFVVGSNWGHVFFKVIT
jgi:1,4-alpha-glucan branching enzyme